MEKETADVLAESREYLEEHGWIKDEMTDGDGRVCSLGAVYASQGFEGNVLAIHEPTILAAASALADALGLDKEYPEHNAVNCVTSWNDEEQRTYQEVLDGFMAAEKFARSGNVS